MAELHSPIGVCVRAGFFEVAAGGQDDVCKFGGLCEENVLHDEEVESRQRLPHLVAVRVGNERVLAEDVHAADRAGEGGLHDLHDGQAGIRVELAAPRGFELRSNFRRGDRLVIGIDHRDEPGIARPLHVVLASQRMQPRARLANVASHQAQRNQTPRVVSSRRVLGDAHSPEHEHCWEGGGARAEGRGILAVFSLDPQPSSLNPAATDRACDRGDVFRGDSADQRGSFRRIFREEQLFEFLKVLGVLGDVGLVDEAFRNQNVHHAVVKRDVGSRFDLREVRREVGQVVSSDVDDNQLRAGFRGRLDKRCRDGVIRRRVAAGDQTHVGSRDVRKDVCDRSGTDRLHQSRNRRRVAQPSAVVDIVRAEAAADEFLKEVRFLVRAFRRAKPGQRGATGLVLNRREFLTDQVERLVPRRFSKRGEHLAVVDQASGATADRLFDFARQRAFRIRLLSPDQRLCESLRVRGVVPAVAALDAQTPVVDGTLATLGKDDPIVLLVKRDRAADSTVRADRVDRVEFFARHDRQRDHLLSQRARRARRDTLAARHARAVSHR